MRQPPGAQSDRPTTERGVPFGGKEANRPVRRRREMRRDAANTRDGR